MSEQISNIKPNTRGREIDIIEILKRLWVERKYIFWGLGVSMILGLIVAFTTPKEYKVVSTMLPQSEEGGGMGNFSSLAAIAGFDINLSDNGSEISPVIFPQIVESEPFLLELMHTKYTFKHYNQSVTLFDYMTKYEKPGIRDIVIKYTIGLPGLIKRSMIKTKSAGKPVNDGLTRMSEDESAIGTMLKGCVTLNMNKKEGYMTLTTILGEPLLTAQVAKKAQELLQEKITAYKTQRAIEQLHFFEKRCDEKKIEYLRAQSQLAGFKDRNLFVTSAVSNSEETRLLAEYNLAFSVYSELAKQLENAKIKVKRVTPVYVIIKPIVVPLEPFAPRKGIILSVFMVFGGFIGAVYVFAKNYLAFLKHKNSDNKN